MAVMVVGDPLGPACGCGGGAPRGTRFVGWAQARLRLERSGSPVVGHAASRSVSFALVRSCQPASHEARSVPPGRPSISSQQRPRLDGRGWPRPHELVPVRLSAMRRDSLPLLRTVGSRALRTPRRKAPECRLPRYGDPRASERLRNARRTIGACVECTLGSRTPHGDTL